MRFGLDTLRLSRSLIPIAIAALILPAVAISGFGDELGGECLVSLASPGFYTQTVRLVMRASGTLEIGIDTRLKACAHFDRQHIVRERQAAYSDYSRSVAAVRSGAPTSIPANEIAIDSKHPPMLGGGSKTVMQYIVPPLSPGDELHERVQASVPPILYGNQLWFQPVGGAQYPAAYNVRFESERDDAVVTLADPAKLLVQVNDAPRRSEWKSAAPVAGASLAFLQITTLVIGRRPPGSTAPLISWTRKNSMIYGLLE